MRRVTGTSGTCRKVTTLVAGSTVPVSVSVAGGGKRIVSFRADGEPVRKTLPRSGWASSGDAVVAAPTGTGLFRSVNAAKFGAVVGYGSRKRFWLLAASLAAWVTTVVAATPLSCASLTSDPLILGA